MEKKAKWKIKRKGIWTHLYRCSCGYCSTYCEVTVPEKCPQCKKEVDAEKAYKPTWQIDRESISIYTFLI